MGAVKRGVGVHNVYDKFLSYLTMRVKCYDLSARLHRVEDEAAVTEMEDYNDM